MLQTTMTRLWLPMSRMERKSSEREAHDAKGVDDGATTCRILRRLVGSRRSRKTVLRCPAVEVAAIRRLSVSRSPIIMHQLH
jgi:hypothetical protein